MSIQSISNNITRTQKEVADLSKKISQESVKENSALKRISQIENSVSKNTSLSSLKSKQSEIIRKQDEINRIKAKIAGFRKKEADATGQLHKYQADLLKEEGKERKKLETAEKKRQQEQLKFQQRLRKELEDTQKASQNLSSSPEFGKIKTVDYDIFISHASEDKQDFVEPLVEELERLEVKVWYDAFTLRVGDSLRTKIDSGLANSRYGIVVLSSSFFAKNWPQYELNGMVAREMNGHQMILPIWHKISKDEVLRFSPTLADKVALNSSLSSVAEIALQLAEVVLDHPNQA